MSNKKFRLAAAAVSAVAIAGLSTTAALGAVPAPPNPVVQEGPASANPALINPAAKATLTLTKYDGTPNGMTADGTQKSVTDRDPLAGVTFKITKVSGVDLNTNAGWEAAKTYAAMTDPSTVPLDSTVTYQGTTGADGQIVFSNLPVALYYVQEVSAPAGYTMGKPFLVTLPMTNPANESEWMYNVYVYPKNGQDTVTKTVTDKGTVTGNTTTGSASVRALQYTITSSISEGLDAAKMGMYVINDNLDPRVNYAGVNVTLSNGTTLERCTDAAATTCDYKVYVGPDAGPLAFQGANTAVTNGPKVSIVFTDAGLAKLAANAGADVVTTIDATTNGSATGDGLVTNTAGVIPNASWWEQNKGSSTANPEDPIGSTPADTPPGITDTAVSKYGDVKILKYDAVGGKSAGLNGAVFTVYKDANNDEACTADELTSANALATSAATVSGITSITGLQLSNFYNENTQTDATTYCLVETKAPDGYNLNAAPVAFTVTREGQVIAAPDFEIANEKSNLGNALPLTGGQGVAAMSALGALLVGGGVAYHTATNRRRQDELA